MAVTPGGIQKFSESILSKETLIYDIKQDRAIEESHPDLRQQIIDELNHTISPSIPSIILWDDAGLKLFEALTITPRYAPFHSELAALNQNVAEMAAIIPSGSLLIELGCGSLQKTSVILSEFERQKRKVTYYALDISHRELVEGLGNLRAIFAHSEYVELRGLLGSYEDGIDWLSRYAMTTDGIHAQKDEDAGPPRIVTFLWAGNSIANFDPAAAAALLKGFSSMCESLNFLCRFVIGVHTCQDEVKILASYDSTEPALRDFILHGLDQANRYLGKDVFLREDWTLHCKFNAADRMLRVYYQALREVKIKIKGRIDRQFKSGDRILAIISGKWTLEDIQQMCSGVGLGISHSWWSPDSECAFHAILPQEP